MAHINISLRQITVNRVCTSNTSLYSPTTRTKVSLSRGNSNGSSLEAICRSSAGLVKEWSGKDCIGLMGRASDLKERYFQHPHAKISVASTTVNTTIRGTATAIVVLLLPGVGGDDDGISICRGGLSREESEAAQEYAPEMFVCTSQRISSSCCSTTVASLSVV